ncbi:hypothetical protein NG799_01855 [Laspinema sp. D1]|uniref:Uncharacterized protein n=2 Tax=Laspinema TaxID=2584823 RepID=A0ABT2MNH2_9CYAN|nr:hypothetical protein [Laspinema sp. D2a]
MMNLKTHYLEQKLFDKAVDVNRIINSLACHTTDIIFHAEDLMSQQIVKVNQINSDHAEVIYRGPQRGLRSIPIKISRDRFDKEFELLFDDED